ncbi:hypothetical protein JMJ35_001057 [Cladonia borealis]|uniref:Uncharacterized protein n=1 Tax=Cladonia borealis TaxID=184061 RepID=A0AA39R9Y9_9LECA|nr:hypothetical protein JMJ35_001057 [Cladonia borealis]
MAQKDRKHFWNREIEVDEKWIQFIDENVHYELPGGLEVLSIIPHAASYWTRTARIGTMQTDRSILSFFIKVAQGDVGRAMVGVWRIFFHDRSP